MSNKIFKYSSNLRALYQKSL